VRRTAPDADYLFLLNHTDEAAWALIGGVDLLTGDEHRDRVILEPGAVAVIREHARRRDDRAERS
jgi:beta-galactosidase